MGLIFNGNGDVIKAVDGSLTVEGLDLDSSSININAGIGTFSSLNVSGAVTYEDVTNVDSIGIITARGGLNVTANTDTDTLNVSGISTFGGYVYIPEYLIHQGDGNTWFRFPSNDTITLGTSGSTRVIIDDGGRMGIKHQTPSSQYFNNLVVGDNNSGDWGITIRTNSSNKGVLAFSDSDSADANRYDGYIAYHHNGQSMRFHTGGANERLRIDSSGNIGVNQTNPSAYGKFVVNGTGNVISLRASSGAASLSFFEGGTGRFYIKTLNGSDGLSFVDGDNSSERLRIDDNGKVLVATTTTSEAHVNQDELIIGSTSDDANHGLTIVTPSSKYGTVAFSDGSSGTSQGLLEYNHSGDYFRIYTAASERFRIDSSGRLLIGTTTEGLGTYGEELTIGSSDHAGITLRTGTGHKGTIYFSDGTSGAAEYKGSVQYDHSDDSLRFASAGSERLRIQSNGRVGVGTASARAFLDLCGAAENATLLLDSNDANANICLNDNTGSIRFLNYGGDLALRTGGTGPFTGDNEALRIDSNRRTSVGRNLTSYVASAMSSAANDFIVTTAAGANGGMSIVNSGADIGNIFFAQGTSENSVGRIQYEHANNALSFTTNSGERLRIGSAGQLGIAGANYGSSGQVLTSQGGSAAPQWASASGTTINNNADNRIITGSGTANTLEGESTLTYDGTWLRCPHDNKGIKIGASDDIQIYHASSGGVNYLKDALGGGWRVPCGYFYIMDQPDSEFIAKFIRNQGCQFYYDNSKKLETTSSGAAVTGALSVTHSSNDQVNFNSTASWCVARFQISGTNRGYVSVGSNVVYLGNNTDGSAIKIKGDSFQFTPDDSNWYNILTSNSTISITSDSDNNTVGGTNAGNVGTWSGASDNTCFGSNAGTDLTNADGNTLIGKGAGENFTSGGLNTAIGYIALRDATTQICNTAVGAYALQQCTRNENTAVGYQAGKNATTIIDTTLMGYRAGYSLTDGEYNTFIGWQAGESLQTGNRNTAVGRGSLDNCVSGSNNTCLGLDSGMATTSSDNVMIGCNAGRTNTTGNSNVYIGTYVADQGTDGSRNVCVGMYAMSSGVSSYNTLIGWAAGHSITSNGNYNTCLGYGAGYHISSGVRNTCIGHEAGYNQLSTDSNELWIARGATGPASTAVYIYGDGSGNVIRAGNSTSWSTTSDRRIKKNIVDNTVGLDVINKIRIRNFEYRTEDEIDRTEFGGSTDDKKYTAEEASEHPDINEGDYYKNFGIDKPGVQLGIIAQELEEVLPNMVNTNPTTSKKTTNTDELLWHLVNAVKELSAENTAMKARLDTLESA